MPYHREKDPAAPDPRGRPIGMGQWTRYHRDKNNKPILSRPHDGRDIYTWGAKDELGKMHGSPVVAVADGTVASVTSGGKLSGNAVRVDFVGEDGTKYSAIYRHLHSASVVAGQKVRKGQKLGIVGNTGSANGIPYPVLCFAIQKNGNFVDPMTVVGKVRYIEDKSPIRATMDERTRRGGREAI